MQQQVFVIVFNVEVQGFFASGDLCGCGAVKLLAAVLFVVFDGQGGEVDHMAWG